MTTEPIVGTSAGTVRGFWRDGSAAFLGIPYAEPPVGDLRFGEPVPHRHWDGVRDATEFGPTPQRKAMAEVTLIPEPSVPGEATLNLNVFTPRPGDTRAGLPVLVYIHGGGFVAGSPASPWYDGAAFNRDGVVTVTPSYRLGFDGFGWIRDAPLNRGVLDWVLALEWVRDNIAQFGGDPGHVTIAGQSAGGGAVLTLLAVPRAASLFHQAISISGTTANVALADAERLGRALARAAGVDPTRAGLAKLTQERVLELQNAIGSIEPTDPLSTLKTMSSGRPLPWAPVIDGRLVPTSILAAVERGLGSDTPLMLGATDNEFNMALTGQRDALESVDPRSALAALGLPSSVVGDYVAAHADSDPADVLGQFITDTMFRGPARAIAELRTASPAPTWLYRFAWTSPTFQSAVHCLDVPFFFDCLAADRISYIAGERPPQALAVDVHSAAVRFIRDGDPGWLPYAAPGRSVRVYDLPSTDVADGFADVAILGDPVAAVD